MNEEYKVLKRSDHGQIAELSKYLPLDEIRIKTEANSLHDTTEQRKRALFLGYCGNHLYKTARTLAAPKDVEAMEWKELQKMLEEHYAPAASSLAHRLDFYSREQKPGETINDYLTNLQDITAGCEFENVEITLRNRIVVGMRDLRLQRKLITKKSISSKEVMEEARAAEILEKTAAKIEKSKSVHSAWGTTSKYQGEGDIGELSKEEEEEIHRVEPDRRSGPQGMSQRPLWCAGCKGNHPRAVCKFRDTICRRCKRKGHIAEACRANLPAYPMWKEGIPHSRMLFKNPCQKARPPIRGETWNIQLSRKGDWPERPSSYGIPIPLNPQEESPML
ncbi:hypothetical protein E2320_018789 [Naja naja]|nr:hypothetical protein E2320_018789 [Naja naja]